MRNVIDVIALHSFRKAAKKLLSETELSALIELLSNNPEKGSVIAGTGGLRKLRWHWRAGANGVVAE